MESLDKGHILTDLKKIKNGNKSPIYISSINYQFYWLFTPLPAHDTRGLQRAGPPGPKKLGLRP